MATNALVADYLNNQPAAVTTGVKDDDDAAATGLLGMTGEYSVSILLSLPYHFFIHTTLFTLHYSSSQHYTSSQHTT